MLRKTRVTEDRSYACESKAFSPTQTCWLWLTAGSMETSGMLKLSSTVFILAGDDVKSAQ